MKVGAHVPVGGDYRKMLEYSLSVGCECAQIFAKNAKQYRFSAPTPAKLDQMRYVHEQCPDFDVNSHTAYLINLSTSKEDIREKSIESMAGEMAIAAMLGLTCVNTHVGNDPNCDAVAAAERAAEAICILYDRARDILREWCDGMGLAPAAELCADGLPVMPTLVLEGAAGAGRIFGVTIDELAAIIDGVLARNCLTGNVAGGDGAAERGIGICIDTCHIWAAGYDVATEAGWNDLIGEVEEKIGLERWLLIHANDSKFGRGTNKDRHEWIGRGEIGLDGFAYMMTCDKLSHVNVALEVPGEEPEKDIVNIDLLKSLRDNTR